MAETAPDMRLADRLAALATEGSDLDPADQAEQLPARARGKFHVLALVRT